MEPDAAKSNHSVMVSLSPIFSPIYRVETFFIRALLSNYCSTTIGFQHFDIIFCLCTSEKPACLCLKDIFLKVKCLFVAQWLIWLRCSFKKKSTHLCATSDLWSPLSRLSDNFILQYYQHDGNKGQFRTLYILTCRKKPFPSHLLLHKL